MERVDTHRNSCRNFIFYLIYSFLIKSNTPIAICMDFLTQLKPFLGFYCTFLIAPVLTVSQKRFLSILCIVIAGGLFILGIIDVNFLFFGHQSRYATAVVATFFYLAIVLPIHGATLSYYC